MSSIDYQFGFTAGYAQAIAEVGYAQAKAVLKHGRWIREPNCWYRCSVCGKHYPSISDNMKYNYCPSCGAKMNEVEE